MDQALERNKLTKLKSTFDETNNKSKKEYNSL
jgi:hypothetical protein